MNTAYLTKIKPFIKRNFPFVKYRWRMISFVKRSKNFIYHNIKGWRSVADLTLQLSVSKNSKLEIKAIDETNRDAFRKFLEDNIESRVYKNWMIYEYDMHNGFIALIDGKIIGSTSWWANNINMNPPQEVIYSNVKLENDEVFNFNFLISSGQRGNRNAISFLHKVYAELKKLGYNYITGLVDPYNLPARWTYMTLGHKDIEPLVQHIFFDRIVYHKKAVFLKESFWHQYTDFACRPLFSFRGLFDKN